MRPLEWTPHMMGNQKIWHARFMSDAYEIYEAETGCMLRYVHDEFVYYDSLELAKAHVQNDVETRLALYMEEVEYTSEDNSINI